MIKFGTGGFRGVIADDFTKSNVNKIAQALAEVIICDGVKTPVIIGYDHRFLSENFASYCAEVLAGNGISVKLYTEAMPSPAVMTAVRDENADYGIMITASHNPYRFNGVKMFLKGGCDADVKFTERLEKIINSVDKVKVMDIDEAKKSELVADYNNKEKYLSNVLDFIDTEKLENNRLNILYDNLYGVGAKCIVPLFGRLKVKNLVVRHVERDAFFGYLMPNPTENAMQSLKEEVISGGYDFAMATDSDVDRLGIIDEEGNYVSSNDIMAILYYYLVRYRNMSGDIVKNCATSVLIDKLAEKLGFCCHEVDVGFKNISAGIKQYDALMGGESSGGLTVRGYIFGKDSTFSSALFTEAVASMGMPVSEIVKTVRNFAGYDMVCLEDQIRFKSEDGLIDYIKANSPTFDKPLDRCEHFGRNFKYYFKDGSWALIRLSGTEPVFRVFAEFNTYQEAKANVEILRNFIDGFDH